MGLAQRTGAVRVRTGPTRRGAADGRASATTTSPASAASRCCDGCAPAGCIDRRRRTSALTPTGRRFFADFGIDLAALESGRRPVCRACLDWSERRSHLGGALGAAILNRLIEKQWVRRDAGRVLTFTREGAEGFDATFGPA